MLFFQFKRRQPRGLLPHLRLPPGLCFCTESMVRNSGSRHQRNPPVGDCFAPYYSPRPDGRFRFQQRWCRRFFRFPRIRGRFPERRHTIRHRRRRPDWLQRLSRIRPCLRPTPVNLTKLNHEDTKARRKPQGWVTRSLRSCTQKKARSMSDLGHPQSGASFPLCPLLRCPSAATLLSTSDTGCAHNQKDLKCDPQ